MMHPVYRLAELESALFERGHDPELLLSEECECCIPSAHGMFDDDSADLWAAYIRLRLTALRESL